MAYTPTDSTPDPFYPSITLTVRKDGEVLNSYEESSESSEEQSNSYEEIEILDPLEAELHADKEEIEAAKEEIDEPQQEVLEIIEVKRPLSAEIEIAKIEQPILIAYNASISSNKSSLEKEAAALIKEHTQFSGTPPIRSPNTQRRLSPMLRY